LHAAQTLPLCFTLLFKFIIYKQITLFMKTTTTVSFFTHTHYLVVNIVHHTGIVHETVPRYIQKISSEIQDSHSLKQQMKTC
jgi:hypothetical protein